MSVQTYKLLLLAMLILANLACYLMARHENTLHAWSHMGLALFADFAVAINEVTA